MMRLALVLLGLAGMAPLWSAAISPDQVVVVYNAAVPESKVLATAYREARGIPLGNMLGLDLPVKADITREEFESTLLKPLRAEFNERGWWQLGKDPNGIIMPGNNQIRVMVTIRGVPLRILAGANPPGLKVDPQDMIGGRNEASVDSELATFGVDGMPYAGVLRNPYFESGKPIREVNFPYLVLTARIDGASLATCQRMILDAVETEKTGLWGRSYVDISNKFPQGDQWLDGVVKENSEAGIPTVVDRFNDTFPKNYPMTDAATYYGWYDWNASGPLLNPRFSFRKGAVAVHIHSFSAEQLVNPQMNWCAPILEKGAAATLGNVFEPYLHLTHHLDKFNKALLAGHTLVEAAWMSIPVASWQGVVLGDPLYRPFGHLDGGGDRLPADIDYRALRAAILKWQADPAERRKNLVAASERMKSGILAEALGLDARAGGRDGEAVVWFDSAKTHYKAPEDKLRQEFNLISIERAAGRKDQAVKALRMARSDYAAIPEAEALGGWLDILDPPAPPPAVPNP